MKKRDDLFHLIKAMSKSEKRYFTLDAKKSSSKGSKYLVLFQAVNDMEIYDEAKLKKKFGKNLRYDKSYLYEAIMRSMRDYRSANSYAARIKEMILDAKYLYERGLYEQCGERLEEAKELAIELDDQLSLLEINKSERLLVRQTKGAQYETKINSLLADQESILEIIRYELKFLDIFDQLLLEVVKKFQLKSKKEIEEFKQRMPDEFYTVDSSSLSPRSVLRYLQCKGFYNQLLGNSDDVLNSYSQIVDWWDSHEKVREDEFHKYVIDISNLLHGYYTKEAYHQFPSLIQKLEEATPKNQHDQGVVFQKVTIYKILYYINTGQAEGIDEVVQSVKLGLDKYQIKSGSRNALIFNTSVMLFMHQRFEQCVNWNFMITKKSKFITRRDIRNGVMILNLVAIFELDDIDRMESYQRSISRYFSKQKEGIFGEFEQTILGFFKDFQYSTDSQFGKKLMDFRDYLMELRKNGQKIALGLDELLLLWVNSKIQKTTILKQIQRLNKSNQRA